MKISGRVVSLRFFFKHAPKDIKEKKKLYLKFVVLNQQVQQYFHVFP